VLRGMTGAVWRSVFVAMLFALHPLHVESVAWVSERKDVLSTLFFILTLWSYGRYVASVRCQEKSEIRMLKSETSPKSEIQKDTSTSSKQETRDTRHATRGFYLLSVLFFGFGLMSKPM